MPKAIPMTRGGKVDGTVFSPVCSERLYLGTLCKTSLARETSARLQCLKTLSVHQYCQTRQRDIGLQRAFLAWIYILISCISDWSLG